MGDRSHIIALNRAAGRISDLSPSWRGDFVPSLGVQRNGILSVVKAYRDLKLPSATECWSGGQAGFEGAGSNRGQSSFRRQITILELRKESWAEKAVAAIIWLTKVRSVIFPKTNVMSPLTMQPVISPETTSRLPCKKASKSPIPGGPKNRMWLVFSTDAASTFSTGKTVQMASSLTKGSRSSGSASPQITLQKSSAISVEVIIRPVARGLFQLSGRDVSSLGDLEKLYLINRFRYWENAVFQRVRYRKKTKDRSKHFQRSDSVRRQPVRVSPRDGQQSGRCSESPMRSASTYKIFTPFNWHVMHPV